MPAPDFRFRLNGLIITEIRVEKETPDSEHRIAVLDEKIGWIPIDDNSHLYSDALPKFKLEYRDETAWALLPIEVRRASIDKGWNVTNPKELIGILFFEGILS